MNKQKQNTKNNKGITLIALIITIVVLLILAVVTIGAAQESNIVGYAQNAAGKYEEGKEIENNTISDIEVLLSQYANGVVPGGNGGEIENPQVTPTPTPEITPEPTPTPPDTTEVRYYKGTGVIQVFEVTGNTAIVNIYSLNGDTMNLLQGQVTGVISNVASPVTINLSGGESEDITTSDEQIEVSGTVSAYIKGNYLYGANIDGDSYATFDLITDSAEIADIEQKIANLNS